ncbi:TPM domain-containing protein [Ancylobacter sonchi]
MDKGASDHVLTADQHVALAEAVRRAEADTSGEVRLMVVTHPLVRHPFYALMWAALLALVLPWPLAFLTPLDVPALLGAQAAAFALAGAQLLATPLGRALVPGAAVEEAARAAALDHFLALGMHGTRGRTGVLILVAPDDRIVEVVADEAIHARVGAGAWQEVCAAVLEGARDGRLAEGLEAGVDVVGRILKAHLPAADSGPNELPDRVLVI